MSERTGNKMRGEAGVKRTSGQVFSAEEATISLQYPDEKRISVIDILVILVRERRLILWSVILITALGLASAVWPRDPVYTAGATVIREESAGSQPGVGALGRLGINFGAGATGLTPSSYPDILRSREVRLAVVRDSFYISEQGSVVQLVDYLNQPTPWLKRSLQKIKGYTIGLPQTIQRALEPEDTSPESARRSTVLQGSSNGGSSPRSVYPSSREEAAMARVQGMLSINLDPATGLMRIGATTPDPRLSADLVSSFLEHLEQRVREIHTEKARQDLQFIQKRYADAEEELLQAESELARFMDRNSGIQSARLMMEQDHLQRVVQRKSQIFGTLQGQVVQAELDLQHSIPVITVLETAVPPLRRNRTSSTAVLLMSIFAGVAVGAGLAFTRVFFQHQVRNETEAAKWLEIKSAFSPGAIMSRLGRSKQNGSAAD